MNGKENIKEEDTQPTQHIEKSKKLVARRGIERIGSHNEKEGINGFN